MPFTEADWDTLITRILEKECMPIIGAGASAPRLPLGDGLALELARKLLKHPAPNPMTLEQVAQCLAVERHDAVFPKKEASRIIAARLALPYIGTTADPHEVLADLALPIYVTTNYDDLLTQALRSKNRPVVREYCRWNGILLETPSALEGNYEPRSDHPLVFHLHGHIHDPRSIVISEDDYLDFLVNLSRDVATANQTRKMLPICVRDGLKNFTLLFVGYRLRDINFRVILRGLLGPLLPSERSMSLTVQLPPREGTSEEEAFRIQGYLDDYFGWTMRLQVYWGTANQFMTDLQRRLSLASASQSLSHG
jgi:hypothetical protein